VRETNSNRIGDSASNAQTHQLVHILELTSIIHIDEVLKEQLQASCERERVLSAMQLVQSRSDHTSIFIIRFVLRHCAL